MNFSLFVQSIFAGVSNGFVYGLIGLGIAVIFRGTRIVNAMQGEFCVVAGMAAVLMLARWHVPPAIAMVCATLLGGLLGILLEWVPVRALHRRGGNEDGFLLLTLGVAFAISALILYFVGRDSLALPGLGGEAMLVIADAAIRVHAVWLIAIGTMVMFALKWFYSKTHFGLSMMAASIDADGAATSGIDVRRMRTATFCLGGLIGGLAGVLVTPLTTVHYAMGLLLTLKGFAAAILGGLTNPFGAVLGGVTLGLLEALAIAFVSSGYKDVIAMSILIVIMILLPNGMLGRRLRKGG
jgi:branched-chain amino acid transport system permease protein